MGKRVTSGRDTRRKHSDALKQELVERSLVPGASVAAIAQEHGINANLLFNWRRLRLGVVTPAAEDAGPPMLLPVTLQMDAAPKSSKTIAPRASGGVIEIDIGATRVRLRGAVDEASVRCVLRLLGAIA
ncbi:MAG: transposase [Variovorax sp.]